MSALGPGPSRVCTRECRDTVPCPALAAMRNIANEKTDRRAATTDLDHTSLLFVESFLQYCNAFVQYLRVVAAFPTFPCGLFTDGTNLLGRVSLSPLYTP